MRGKREDQREIYNGPVKYRDEDMSRDPCP